MWFDSLFNPYKTEAHSAQIAQNQTKCEKHAVTFTKKELKTFLSLGTLQNGFAYNNTRNPQLHYSFLLQPHK